ncbi:MAG TPA: Bax inhibitor-1/YccA family protein [Mycobacteriales bacterium]|jgi:uncharacterized YccA/Bax inhibitor family protein|nr:Bax inhibitor-1/YccA family protein [Mycobacteriales bacterium]
MALQSSNNPVFARSAPLIESLRGAPTPQEVADVYGTPQRLTVDDIMVKTGLLLGILVVTGAAAWTLDLSGGVIALAAIVGFVLALVNIFKREVSPPLVLAYAAVQGVAIGGISKLYEDAYNGIVVQAVIGTVAVFAAVTFGYRSGWLRATPRFTKVVTYGFIGLFAVLVLNLLVGLFGDGDALGIRGGNPVLSVLFSLAFITFGALTFVMDFDQAERMVAGGAPERESWRIAFGLVVGLVWLYLEVLRLLSYLQGARR